MNQNQVDKLVQLDADGCTILLWGDNTYIEGGGDEPVIIWTSPDHKWDMLTLDTEDIRVVEDVVGWEDV